MNKKTKRLLEENNCREKALSQESQAVMTDLVVYLRGQNISMYHQEEVRWDIQEMVLEAENRGETIAQVIGEDYQTFCDEIVAALPPRTWKERILDALETLLPAIAILAALWVGFSLLTAAIQGASLLWLSLPLGQGLMYAVILFAAWALVTYVCRTSFRRGNEAREKVVLGLAAAGVVALVLLEHLLTWPAVTVPLPGAALMVAVPLLLYFFLSRRA
ncbi:hypothetical protein [Evtepia sp.]|uniref:hypothetical protein n=1 Tax=Evtepia sp. TaxID=2773933 RepID=UPI002A8091CA|nr:hypothetical protein [Evtepia sp.]MDY4429508.1 hypothetical protein [Evtepia sp.]